MAKIQRCPVCDVVYATADGICPHCGGKKGARAPIATPPTRPVSPPPVRLPSASSPADPSIPTRKQAFHALLEATAEQPIVQLPDKEKGVIRAEFLNRAPAFFDSGSHEYVVLLPLDTPISDPDELLYIRLDRKKEMYTIIRPEHPLFGEYMESFLFDCDLEEIENPSPRLRDIYPPSEDDEEDEDE